MTNPSTAHIHDSDEVKTSVEQTIQRFLDVGRQIECFFLQKRLLLSVQSPELLLTEDCIELRNEIARKDQILNKYYEKLQIWQSMVNETVGTGDGTHHLQKPISQTQPSGQVPPTQMVGQPPTQPQLTPQLRHTVQSPVGGGGGPHLMRPSMGPQMTGASGQMTPPQMMASSQMTGPGGMLPPPPPQSGQPPNASMMGQMGGQPTGQPMPQYMTQQSHPVQLQGPLAYLERTTSNIGLPDPRR